MPIVMNSNLASLKAIRALGDTNKALGTTLARLSSGIRVSTAGDDASGVGVASRMLSQIRGANQAVRNANDAISLAQVADSGLSETVSNLQSMRVLAVAAANSSYLTADRANMNLQFQALVADIQRVAQGIAYNNTYLLSGGFANMNIQIGANSGDVLSLTFLSATSSGLGISGNVSLGGSDGTTATAAITLVDNAIASVSYIRAVVGAQQTRLQNAVSFTSSYSDTMTSSYSNVADTDISQETSNLARLTIIQQVGVAIVAQANLQPQMVLSLLKQSTNSGSG
ncbi:MAG: flagellin FliC [Magnetococcales bacterium]|nr:flagellin FliC [Magnetococcales bacterium]